MGYDVHITRADDWSANEGCEISTEEWHAIIEQDPSLRLAGYNGPHFAIWDGHPEDREAWLDWFDGNITTKYPDEALLGKMLEIANRLNAKVQGDEGEVYPLPEMPVPAARRGLFSSAWGRSLLLVAAAYALLTPLFVWDSMVRPDHSSVVPRPIGQVLVIAPLMVVGMACWFAAIIFAVMSLLAREPKRRLAYVVLLANGVALAMLWFLR